MESKQAARRLGARLRARLTYANVMSTIAVFAVLGGGAAWAAATIGPKDIKRNAVHTKHLEKRAVETAKIDKGAVTSAKLADGAVKTIMRQGPTVSVKEDSFAMAEASCRPGERATGGGVYNESNVFTVRVTSSYPTPNPTTPPPTGDGEVPTGWRVWVANSTPGTNTQTVNAYVICASR